MCETLKLSLENRDENYNRRDYVDYNITATMNNLPKVPISNNNHFLDDIYKQLFLSGAAARYRGQ